jgi:cytochrome c oxidase subunit 2
VKFRHSQGAIPDTTMVHSTKVEIIWTIIPVIILVVMAVPAADLILKQEDTRNSEACLITGWTSTRRGSFPAALKYACC